MRDTCDESQMRNKTGNATGDEETTQLEDDFQSSDGF